MLLCLEVLALAFLFLLAGQVVAVACPPEPFPEIVVEKNTPLGCEMLLDATVFPDVQDDPDCIEWYGPFAPVTDPDRDVLLPEGAHTITMFTCDGGQRSDPQVLHVRVEPGFDILPVPLRGKAVVVWPRLEGARQYIVYRASESSPGVFEQITQLPSSTSLYTDTGLGEATYLYVVGVLKDGHWSYSQVRGVHPFALWPKLNYPPLIWSPPVLKGTVGIEYTYDVNAADPYRDELTYILVGPPPGMAIDCGSGLITWKPRSVGDYEIVVKAKDGKGLYHAQTFIIEVDELPEMNRAPVADAGGPYQAEPGQALVFNGTGSSDPDGDPLSLVWHFGDGTTGTGSTPGHTYSGTGTYQVSLTVTDGRGGEDTDTATATVTTCVPPTVNISANPAAVLAGEPCALLWSSQNATAVTLDHGIGAVGASGSLTVHPSVTTTYTITAYGPCGTAADSVTVVVYRPPAVDITADPLTIIAGQSSLLSWTSSHADSLSIDQGIGTVSAQGSMAISPLGTTTYTITAAGAGGVTTDSVTVTVLQPPQVTISAQPLLIIEGGSSSLTWMSEHASSASLDNGIGQVTPDGSLEVWPQGTTTYTITVQGQGGTATASAMVEVIPRPTATITASPNPIDAGETSLLSWTSTHAEGASLDQGIGAVAAGGTHEVSPAETTTYTIIATGPGGTATASVTVEVNHPQPVRKTCAYITNCGGNDVTAIDIDTNTVISRIETGYGPYGVDVSPDGDKVYVTTEEEGIVVIDAATNTVAATIPVNATTVAASPDGAVLYAVSTWEGTLTALDAATHELRGSVAVGPSPRGIAVKPDGTRIYVSSLADGTIRVIDAASLEVLKTIQAVGTWAAVCDIEVSPDGSKLYAVSDSSIQLTVIDTSTNDVVDSRYYLIERTPDDAYLGVSPDGERLYLSFYHYGGSIYVIDADSLEITGTIETGYPSDMAFTPDGARLYLPDVELNIVPIIDTLSHEITSAVEDAFTSPYTCGHFMAEHRERIAGRVTADGQGVEGITAILTGGHHARIFITDSQGRYFFYAPAGGYTLSFDEAGHVFSRQTLGVEVVDHEVSVDDTQVLLGVRLWGEPEAISSGGSAVLHWETLKAAEVSIDQGIGEVGLGGSRTVSPDETTIYTITVGDGQGRTVSNQVTIVVYQPPVVSLVAYPTDIAQGHFSTLSWTCTNADVIVLEPMGWTMSSSGSYMTNPGATTTYSIVATGPGGTTTASVTVTLHQPPVLSISVDPQTIYAGQPATLSWTSSDAVQVSMDNGIGSVALNGSLPVSPSQTTTYTVSATGPGGTATAAVTVTVNSIISLHIDSPAANSLIKRPDVLVRGTVSHAYGYETGVSVNGFPAMVCGNRFVANHVPLDLGQNEIVVRAVDKQGNSTEVTMVVMVDTLEPIITLTPCDMVGVAPFQTKLGIRSNIGPSHISLSDTGPGPLLYEQGENADERFIQTDVPGIYVIRAQENITGAYDDTAAIIVFEREELDDLLREKWEHLRNALMNNDIDEALLDIAPSHVDDYQRIFNALTPEKRSKIAGEMQDIQLIDMMGGSVEYDIRTIREGRECSFLLRFEMDDDGFWKIDFF